MSRISTENLVILILSKDRLKYLLYTWSSVQKTTQNIPIFVYDDGSTDEDLLRFLTTDDEFILSNPFNINCEVLSKYVGQFFVTERVRGILSKINLRRFPNGIGHTPMLFRALKEIFYNNPRIEYIIQLEDDVVFKEKWLDTIIDSWNSWTIINRGILGSCAVQNEHRKKSHKVIFGNPTFQCVVIPRYIYEVDPNYFDGPWKFSTKADLYMNRYCRELGFENGLLGQSICQHIGVDSVELACYQEYFSKDYPFDWRLDITAEPPFVI